MYILSWFLTIVVALLATMTIVLALPRSAADELSTVTTSRLISSDETECVSTIVAARANKD